MITELSRTATRPHMRGRVLVVDDSEIFQQVGTTLVSEAQGLDLVGVAASGEEAIRLLPELSPNLVLLDVHMPGMGGLEAARVIRRESPETVVVLVSADPRSVAIDTRSIGAADLLSKIELSPARLDELWLEHLPRPRLAGSQPGADARIPADSKAACFAPVGGGPRLQPMARDARHAVTSSSLETGATPHPARPETTPGRLTWLGHSCVAIRLDGLLVVTDPVVRKRIVHLRRKGPVDSAALDGVDVVLISHIHHDHLDLPSLDRLGTSAQVIVPMGAGGLLRRRGFGFVREVVAGDEVDVGTIRVRVTHAEHASGFRMGTTRTQPVGYVIAGTRTVYFAGDTDLFQGMGALGRIDVALLPVAGWGSRLPAGHLDPVRAVEALALTEPRLAIPIHWGTYAPWRPPRGDDTPAKTFAELAATIVPAVDVRVLRPGQSCPIE